MNFENVFLVIAVVCVGVDLTFLVGVYERGLQDQKLGQAIRAFKPVSTQEYALSEPGAMLVNYCDASNQAPFHENETTGSYSPPSNVTTRTSMNQTCVLTNLVVEYYWLAPDGSVIPVILCDFNCSGGRSVAGLADSGINRNDSKIFLQRRLGVKDYWLLLYHEQCHQLVNREFLNSTNDEERFCYDYASDKLGRELALLLLEGKKEEKTK